MRFEHLVCLFIASFACGQAAQPSTNAAPATTQEKGISNPTEIPRDPVVAPDDAVITIDDFCPDGPRPYGACKAVVTRAQFEKLTEALQPGMPLPLRLKVAYAYAKNIRMAAAAEKRGLDKTSAFEEEMRYARMQLLSQDLSRALQEDANNISDSDFEEYYKKNESSFEEATMARLFVPHDKRTTRSHATNTAAQAAIQPGAVPKADEKTSEADLAREKTDEAGLATLADELRTRAVNGEDPDKLQSEAFAAAGVEGMAANTKVLRVRRQTLPPTHAMVMNLQPGGVSEVITDPGSAGAHFIYKMIAKRTLTLEEAKGEMREEISKQRYHKSMEVFLGNAVYNDAYFNPPSTQPASAPHRHQRERRAGLPASPTEGQN